MSDPGQLWQTALGQLQLMMNRANYQTYFSETVGLELEGDTLVVGVHNPNFQPTLERSFVPLVRRALADIARRPLDVRFQPVSVAKSTGPTPLFGEDPTASPFEAPPERAREPRPSPSTGSPLNPRDTFETLVVGNNNGLAHAAAVAVAQEPALRYNPLFIYGGVGLGKTHLLHAIGHEVRQAGLDITYVSSERFTNDLIDSIRQHRTEEFRQMYRLTRLLLIDDIQFMAGKERTQEEFFHTFNALHESGAQIVMSSDRPPGEIPTVEERLRSRFAWGLIADIQQPDLETRIAILRSKLNGHAAAIPGDALEFVARKAQSNIRELEGALNRVLAYSHLQRKPVTVDLAAEALQGVIAPSVGRSSLSPETLLQVVARYASVSLADLRGKTRDKRVVAPRHLAMYLLREDLKLSTPEIGRLLGSRDHSTVMHGCNKIAADLRRDAAIADHVEAIRDLLRASASPGAS
jgi:chromosomal replication initiator protein